MLVGDESQAQAALSRGLDLHTDVLGQPNRYPVLNWVVQEIVQCAVAVMGPLIPTLVFCVQGTVELLKRIVREVGKLFHKSSSSDNEEDEEDEGTDALYSAKGLLGTSRPKDFVLPQGTASPLVLAVLGSQDLFQTFLEKAPSVERSVAQNSSRQLSDWPYLRSAKTKRVSSSRRDSLVSKPTMRTETQPCSGWPSCWWRTSLTPGYAIILQGPRHG